MNKVRLQQILDEKENHFELFCRDAHLYFDEVLSSVQCWLDHEERVAAQETKEKKTPEPAASLPPPPKPKPIRKVVVKSMPVRVSKKKKKKK